MTHKSSQGTKTHYFAADDKLGILPYNNLARTKCGRKVKLDHIVTFGEDPTCRLCLPDDKRKELVIQCKAKTGVIAELDGKYWGKLYEDGHVCEMGYGGIETATICEPEFCKRPVDMTNQNSPNYRDLQKATLKMVKKDIMFTITEVE